MLLRIDVFQNTEDSITSSKKKTNDEFATVMRALIWRYISMKHQEMENMDVNEDDINEIKSELSTMKYDFLEVLRKNGMEVPSDQRRKTSKYTICLKHSLDYPRVQTSHYLCFRPNGLTMLSIRL